MPTSNTLDSVTTWGWMMTGGWGVLRPLAGVGVEIWIPVVGVMRPQKTLPIPNASA